MSDSEAVGGRRSEALDRMALEHLGRELEDEAVAPAFARSYRRMLPARVQRIHAALLSDDIDTAMEAILSLKVSSATVGTGELADLARALEGAVRRHDVAAARETAADLPVVADRAERALLTYLIGG